MTVEVLRVAPDTYFVFVFVFVTPGYPVPCQLHPGVGPLNAIDSARLSSKSLQASTGGGYCYITLALRC